MKIKGISGKYTLFNICPPCMPIKSSKFGQIHRIFRKIRIPCHQKNEINVFLKFFPMKKKFKIGRESNILVHTIGVDIIYLVTAYYNGKHLSK